MCFRGPKAELPKGADGTYGTSVTYGKAMDPTSDVIIAYKQNGRWLTPDHGFPVRIIIPGFIGGRMIKWLEEITVTAGESDNFYHFHDNRVMPSHVDEELAKAEGGCPDGGVRAGRGMMNGYPIQAAQLGQVCLQLLPVLLSPGC